MSKMNRVVRAMVISYVAVGTLISASASFAADAQSVDIIEERIGTGGSIYSSSLPPASNCHVVGQEQMKVDVIEERIGTGGSIYSSSDTQSQYFTP